LWRCDEPRLQSGADRVQRLGLLYYGLAPGCFIRRFVTGSRQHAAPQQLEIGRIGRVMQFAWPAWILMICAVASFVCVAIGAAMAGIAFARFSKHLKRTQAEAEATFDVARTEAALARIDAAVEGIGPLIVRAQNALITIQVSLEELRLPEASLALRTAGAAVRFLFSGR